MPSLKAHVSGLPGMTAGTWGRAERKVEMRSEYMYWAGVEATCSGCFAGNTDHRRVSQGPRQE